jgi:amino acid adenylation domain-containing protein
MNNGKAAMMNWKEFASSVEALAAQMQAQPAGRVALVLKRSPALMVAQAASHVSGRTFIPMDPKWPAHRIADLLEETDTKIVLCDQDAVYPADLFKDRVTMKLSHVGRCSAFTAGELKVVEPPEIMYIMFTSGSTGKPKGVEVPTAGVFNFLIWKADVLKITKDDTLVLKTPYTFDVSISEIWMYLLTGSTVWVLSEGAHMDGAATHKELLLSKATVVHFVPSMMLSFFQTAPKVPLPHLRMVQATGEALKMEHRRKLSQAFGSHVQLINLYGPTEATVEVTWFDCKDNNEEDLAHGFPISGARTPANVGLYIVDVNDPTKLMPDGEKGELCISGVQVAKGYLNRPDLTSERFIPCPWDKSAGGRMYRTGDIACRDPVTGRLEYNGRADRQVKVGGVRIELGEIETVTTRLFEGRMEACAVVLVEGALTGVMFPAVDKKLPSGKEVAAALADELPRSYVPTNWHVFNGKIPIGSAGKIDYNFLESWVTEQKTMNAWAEVYDYLFDDLTSDDSLADPTMDWSSYRDSFAPERLHTKDVIHEWVMVYVEEALRNAARAAGTEKDASVLEMGCGKGMLLLKMAPRVNLCIGTDISNNALRHVDQTWKGHCAENGLQGCNNTFALTACDAASYDAVDAIHPDKFHVVMCNGVSMYLPSFTYLMRYFHGAVDHVKEDVEGCVMLGDVRSIHHARLFKLREFLFLGKSADEARKESLEATINDKDRTYDYRAFHLLMAAGLFPDRVSAVEVQLKLGGHDSEFSGYRYDVTCHCAPRDSQSQGDSESSSDSSSSGSSQDAPSADIVVACDYANVAASDVSVQAVVSAMQEATTDSISNNSNAPVSVFCALNIPNQRLWADHLVGCAKDDNASLGQGGGVKPAALRAAMEQALPQWHLVLTWSRGTGQGKRWSDEELASSRIASMDLYAIPKAPFHSKMAGLNAITHHCLELHPELESLVKSKAACTAALENFISEIPSVKQTGDSKTFSSEESEAAAVACLDQGDFEGAVHNLVAGSLSMCPKHLVSELNSQPSTTYQELGGNSFMGMKLIGRMRDALGNGSTVFTLLSEPLEAFIKESVHLLKNGTAASSDRCYVRKETEGSEGSVALNAPTVVFYPSGGASPKAFANTATEIFKVFGAQKEGGVTLIAQLPGREERSDEENTTDWRALVESMATSLATHLKLDQGPCEAPVVMAGDSLGALLVWEVTHELQKRYAFLPKHIVVSGNPSPHLSSSQWGFGSVATCSIRDCSDAQLVDFLNQSARRGEEEGFTFSEDGEREVIEALRSDCTMFEDFRRPSDYQALNTSATVVRGGSDPLTLPTDMDGWSAEFAQSHKVVLEGAGHQIYSEVGPQMSQLLARALGLSC